MITENQINKFIEEGVIVIEDVLSEDEIKYYRDCYHEELDKIGYNYENIINGIYENVDFDKKRDKLTNSFYYNWKMELQADNRIYEIFKKIILSTKEMYGIPECSDVLPFLDRVGLRFPDHIYPEGGLNLHLDKIGKKFRPNIQNI
jgi:hypothetical protein